MALLSLLPVVFLLTTSPAESSANRPTLEAPQAWPIVLSGQSNADFLTPSLRAVYAGNVVSVARGSVSIAEWAPTGPLWASLHEHLTPHASAFVWWQGESDPQRRAYGAELIALVERVRRALDSPSLPVIVIRAVNDPRLTRVRAAQRAFVDRDRAAVLVSVDDLQRESPDSFHLTAAGYAVVAIRILNALAAIQPAKTGS